MKREPVESLQSHFILTTSHWSSGLPICFPTHGAWVQIPRGVLIWNRDSPVSNVSLHWWPWRDWSLWPCLRWASSQTVTRPSCQQCNNPTWSHTAFLSQGFTLAAGLPSGISLHSHHVSLVQWTTYLLPDRRGLGSNPCGVLMWNRDFPVSVVSLQTPHSRSLTRLYRWSACFLMLCMLYLHLSSLRFSRVKINVNFMQ